MTSAETMERASTGDAPDAPPTPGGSLVVRLHALAAAGFFVLGASAAALAAWQLVEPTLLEGTAETTYGRLLPASLHLLVFGWLTIGLIGVAYHAVPRMTRTALALPTVALLNLGLMAASVAVGVGAILIGEGDGGRLLEMPWYADLPLLAACAGAAFVLVRTVRASDGPIGVGAWYLVASPVWLTLSVAAGALPGLDGVPGSVQSAFTLTAVYGLWLAPAAIGAAYFVVARALPDAAFHPRLGRIGFWSLTFTWVWTAGRFLQYGPTNDWVETIPVAFAAGLVVAVITVAADFAYAFRARWDEVAKSATLGLVVGGGGLLVLGAVHAFVSSLRSASLVVRFTSFETAFDALTVLGAFTLLAAAGLFQAAAGQSGRAWGRGAAALVLWPVGVGSLLAAFTSWLAGLQQGYAWLSGVESDSFDNFGDGFAASSADLDGSHTLTAIAISLTVVGALFLLLGVLRRMGGGPADDAPADAAGDTETVRGVLTPAVLLFAVTALAVFAFPAIDSQREATRLAATVRDLPDGSPAALGQELYVSEGCWVCHTQEVRAVVTDVGLGPVSVTGDYHLDDADVLGVSRIGPDLMHAGSRPLTEDAAWVAGHLRDPRAERPWSTMPSYAHLDDAELSALAAYIAGLD